MIFEKKDLIKNVIRGLLVFTLFWYSSYFQLIPLILLKLDIRNLSNSMQVVLSAFSSLMVFLILFFVYRKELKKDFKKFKENMLGNIDIGIKCWVSGLLIMMISNIILTVVFKSGGANNENAVQEMIKSLPWLMVINAGIIAPFNEEIIFRKTLKDIFKNKWIFVTLSFLLFGGAHVISSAKTLVDFLYIIPYGSLGAAFALAYYKTDTIFTSLGLHIAHNTILSLVSILIL